MDMLCTDYLFILYNAHVSTVSESKDMLCINADHCRDIYYVQRNAFHRNPQLHLIHTATKCTTSLTLACLWN